MIYHYIIKLMNDFVLLPFYNKNFTFAIKKFLNNIFYFACKKQSEFSGCF